jgi:hypothetical protein
MPRVTFHEEAESELNAAALYYEDRAPDLGLAFLDEFREGMEGSRPKLAALTMLPVEFEISQLI